MSIIPPLHTTSLSHLVFQQIPLTPHSHNFNNHIPLPTLCFIHSRLIPRRAGVVDIWSPPGNQGGGTSPGLWSVTGRFVSGPAWLYYVRLYVYRTYGFLLGTIYWRRNCNPLHSGEICNGLIKRRKLFDINIEEE